jgi:peroxiredoxin
MGEKLRSGDTLPAFTLELVGGGTTTLPTDLNTDFGVVLFYRGHW